MANVPIYDAVFYSVIVILVAIVFVELRRVRRAIDDTNGLYKVMLDHVLEVHGPFGDGVEQDQPDDDDSPS